MKPKAKKPAPRPRKKSVESKPAKSAGNGVSSPYGYRTVEMDWMNKHPEKLRRYTGEYVILEGTEIIAHGTDTAKLVAIAKRRGVRTPFIFFVPPPLPKNTIWIGP